MEERIKKIASELTKQRVSKFWLDGKDQWPIDTAGYEFLANAVLKVGKAMFPGRWTGREPGEWAVASFDRNVDERPATRSKMAQVVRTIATGVAEGDLRLATRPPNDFFSTRCCPVDIRTRHSHCMACFAIVA